MKTALPILVVLVVFAPSCRDSRAPRCERLVDARSNIPIILGTEEEMFPAEWLVPSIGARATPLAGGEFDRSLSMIRKAMSKYPLPVLQKNLEKVYVVGELFYSDICAAGTNSRDRVYIANDGVRLGYSSTFLEKAFHHEFSSILLRNYPEHFRGDRWKSANPTEFVYHESGVDAVKLGHASEAYDARLARDGFISEYAQWTLEDDFNSIVQGLFIGDENLWGAYDDYERIRVKVTVAIDFLHSLDASFTKQYFLELATNDAAQ